jgi:signal transduction histidine kinase
VQAERDPAASREALQTVETVARETLGEIDRIVGALRSDGDGDAAAEPLPGLAAIDKLAGRYRDAGMEVTVDIRGTRRALPGSVDRAAYRIIQEALTNAARHGDGAATVEVEYGAEQLRLTATNPVDPGRPSDRDGGGRGLVGMRERATLLGGGLDVAREGGTFRVAARLPYDAPEDA